MASKVTQHKAQRDSNRKELTELKKENAELRRTVSRLKKLLTKAHTVQEMVIEPEEELATVAVEVAGDELKCTECGSVNLTEGFLTPGGKTIRGCRDCKARLIL